MKQSEGDHGLSRRDVLRLSAAAAFASAMPGQDSKAQRLLAAVQPETVEKYTGAGGLSTSPGSAFRRVTLEMSLKPFHTLQVEAIDGVCEEVFRSWAPLIRRCDGCAIMLWAADGSEILDYRGHMEDAFDWARYLGIANPPQTPPADDPARRSAHDRNWLYMNNPPTMTYGWLRTIIASLKRVGHQMTGKPITVGATFDPGPEFAHSDFKYVRHPEVSSGHTMGAHTFTDCTATLKSDERDYAGFPHGIPEGTSFGTFFGRQSKHFLADLGYDYIWFSNGFGFSISPWNATGPLFNGERFDASRAGELRESILKFWRDFRKECTQFPIETRGSNMIVGADLATSGSPVLNIYREEQGVIAPPNSPWAAINGDVGLEIVGYLSRIAELPPNDIYPFRFYTHDPWWMNSPWFDRYGREPYDIYLPLALARINGNAEITPPSYLEILTIDNSYGRMPEQVPNEVIPYILNAQQDSSDAPGVVTWIYPFDEYHEMTFGSPPRLEEVFFGDWVLRNAVNNGFPLNSVVSTRQFAKSYVKNPEFYRDTVLLAYAPVVHGDLEKLLLDGWRQGQNILLYGPIDRTGSELISLLNLQKAEPLVEGVIGLNLSLVPDKVDHGQLAFKAIHRNIMSAGAIDTVLSHEGANNINICATASRDGVERVVTVSRPKSQGSGTLAWVRGSFCCSIAEGHQLPKADDPAQYFPVEALLRLVLAEFGYSIRFTRPLP